MNRRTILTFTVLSAAGLAATVTAEPSITPPSPAYLATGTGGDEQPTAVADEERSRYLVHLSFKKGQKTIASPTVMTIANQPATLQTGSERPFVIGIGKDGQPIIKVMEEGIVAHLTITECRDGVVTLDVTMALTEITDVGRRGAVQTVKATTQQVRVIEPVLIGGKTIVKCADGTEITAFLEAVEDDDEK